jgi:hypothetical protein
MGRVVATLPSAMTQKPPHGGFFFVCGMALHMSVQIGS